MYGKANYRYWSGLARLLQCFDPSLENNFDLYVADFRAVVKLGNVRVVCRDGLRLIAVDGCGALGNDLGRQTSDIYLAANDTMPI